MVNTFLCSSYGIAPEVIDIKHVKIIKLKSGLLNLQIGVLVLNKNKADVKIENVCLNLITENDTIGSVFEDKNTVMKGNDTTEVSFYTNLKTHKVLELASEQKDILTIIIKGEVNVDLGLTAIPADIDLSYAFNLKRELAETIERDTKEKKLIKIKKAILRSLNLGESTVEIGFTLTNPYDVDIILKEYPSQIFINEINSGKGKLTSEIKLPKENSAADGSAIYELSNLNTIKSLFGSVFTGKLEYRTNGTVFIDILGYDIQFPFNFEGELIKI
jgi:LEA14-like dessication related protein